MSGQQDAYEVGYRKPPVHSRFQPGQSGNPSGRPKESKNFKTLLHAILNEQIQLQEGSKSKKVTKAEAIMRRLIVGAMKGDSRDLHALFRLAEQTGQFEKDGEDEKQIVEIVRFAWQPTQEPEDRTVEHEIPANRRINRD